MPVAVSHIEVSGYINNTTFGNIVIAPSFIDNTIAPENGLRAVLAAGDNSVVIPNIAGISLCAGVIIVFDPTSTTTKKLKGSAGDTGVTLGTSGVNLIVFDQTATPGFFMINCSAADTGKITHILFF